MKFRTSADRLQLSQLSHLFSLRKFVLGDTPAVAHSIAYPLTISPSNEKLPIEMPMYQRFSYEGCLLTWKQTYRPVVSQEKQFFSPSETCFEWAFNISSIAAFDFQRVSVTKLLLKGHKAMYIARLSAPQRCRFCWPFAMAERSFGVSKHELNIGTYLYNMYS